MFSRGAKHFDGINILDLSGIGLLSFGTPTLAKRKNMEIYQNIIENLSKYAHLNKEELNYFTSHLTVRKFKKRQFLVQANDPCQYDYFINKGLVKEYFTDPNGKDFIFRFVQENDWSSDYQSYFNGTFSKLNIEALEHTETFTIDRSDTNKIMEKYPVFEKTFRIYFQNTYSRLQNRLFVIVSKTTEQRYSEFLANYPNLVNRIPQHQIAAYLGVSAEFISKIRQRS